MTQSFIARKTLAGSILAALPLLAAADEGAPQLGGVTTITVVGARQPLGRSGTIPQDRIERRRGASSDTASLLDDVAGVSFYGAGGVSSLPVIHGFNDDRVRVEVDGMAATSACGNHMNPPLSYIDPSKVAKVSVYAGISPVSQGGDSIGGTISIESADPEFAEAGERLIGASLGSFYRSNGDGFGANLSATAANDWFSARIESATAQSGNYKAGNGQEVKSTSYSTQNTALTLAGRSGDSLVVFEAGLQYIPYEAYPNARMDTSENKSYYFNLKYSDSFSWGTLDARTWYKRTLHEMDKLSDKGGAMPMNTDGKDVGYSISVRLPLSDNDVLRVGNEFHRFMLDDWWPPVPGSSSMGPGTYENIRDGRRDRLGTYAEWERQWAPAWKTSLGARYDRVSMDTGNVRPYSFGGMSAADAAAANAFNALDHKRVDDNVDVTALVRYAASATSRYEAGYARKSRSPNLYERYSWGKGRMAMLMTGWFGDANGYVGDIDLKPEVAHTVSATADWRGAGEHKWKLRVTPYYSYVEDFIDVERCAVSVGACTAANVTERANFVFLKFANHDARLYGVDLSGEVPLADDTRYGSVMLKGSAAYVHGEDADTGDNLYNIMPLTAKFALEHELGKWSNVVELQLVRGKHDVQSVRNELRTSGYGLLNLRTRYQWDNVSLDAGIENALDKYYEPPLGGAYIGESPVKWGQAVGGKGRSFYVAVGLSF